MINAMDDDDNFISANHQQHHTGLKRSRSMGEVLGQDEEQKGDEGFSMKKLWRNIRGTFRRKKDLRAGQDEEN